MSGSEEPNERCLTPCLDENQCITDSTNGITNISSPDVNLDDNLDSVTQEEPEKTEEESKQEQEPTSSSNNVLNKSGSSGFDPIEGVSDISDEEDENLTSEIVEEKKVEEKCNIKEKSSANGENSKAAKPTNFKKITQNTRERNYRDRLKKKPFPPNQRPPGDVRPYRKIDERLGYNRYDKRREIARYNVRNVVAGRKHLPRDFSRSRSPSYSPKRMRRSNSRSPSPNYRNRGRSPYHRGSPRSARKVTPRQSFSHSPSLSLSPPPPSHRYRSRSISPPLQSKYMRQRSKSRSRSRERIEKFYRRRTRSPKKKKKEGRKRKKSRTRSRSIRGSPESLISSRSLSVESGRQIVNNVDPAWPPGKPGTENLKVILKNSDAIAKKKSKKKRERKRDAKKKPKELRVKRPEKIGTDPEVASKEVFASGDNILVSVSFNNKPKDDDFMVSLETSSQKSKSKRRRPSVSPNSTQSLTGETDGELEKRRRKKKGKNRKEKNAGEAKAATGETTASTPTTKRKSDMKPIAIIDLDKSPIKEIGSPKDVIVLSDSDGENKKHQKNHQNKEPINLVQDDNQKTPMRVATPPESPPPQASISNPAPTVQFSFQPKSKSLVLPFNPAFVHEQDEDEEEVKETSKTPAEPTEPPGPSPKMQEEKPVKSPDAYDPFEPTKSGSNSPISTPPRANDVTSSSDMLKESAMELQENQQQKNVEDGLITSSIWNKKDMEKKPCTPPLPASPSPVFQPPTQAKSGTISLYSPVALQQQNNDKIPGLQDDLDGGGSKDMSVDLKSPYSPSSEDYNDLFEPPEPSPPPPSSQRTPSTFIDTSSVINLTGKGGISSFETMKLNVDYDKGAGKSGYGGSSNYFNKNSNEPKKALTLTASTLKTFNSQRSNLSQTNIFSKMGLNFVNKNEMNIIENFTKSPAGLPLGSSGTITTTQTNSQQKGGRTTSSFTRTKTSRFSKLNESNGSPVRHSSSFHHDSFKDIDDVPNSAVDLLVHDKWVKKINRQERVVEEVKLVLKPIFNKKQITKDEYKDILRRAVPKICHNRTGEINVQKIRSLVHAYVKKVRYKRKSDTGKLHASI